LDQRLVGSIGFTAFGGERAAIDEMIGCGLFTSMNAAFSVLNPSANIEVPASFGDPDYRCAIERARAAGLGVMAIRVLGGGVLATQSSSDPRLSTLVALAKEAACSVEELAIRFVLSTEGVQTAILGLSAVDHVRVAAAAVDQGPLDPELYSALEQVSLASFPS
jgi:aryl-alcohol dehydrogenase-like predicted oxidoreductase